MLGESQGRLSFWQIALIVFVPAAVALAGGVWLATQAMNVRAERMEKERIGQASSQARLLLDGLQDEIEVIRTRALGLERLGAAADQKVSAGYFEEVLYFAVLNRTPSGWALDRTEKKPDWSEPLNWDREYLTQVVSQIDAAALENTGVALLRLKQETGRANELLALAFPVPGAPNRAVMAWVDPATAFPIFARWSRQPEGSHLRAYLVGSDGFVLAHSQKTYTGADFSRLPIFQEGLKDVFAGNRLDGGGTYSAIDQSTVQASFVKPGHLPFALVVERVSEVPGGLPSGAAARSIGGRIALPLLLITGVLSAILYGAALLIRRRVGRMTESFVSAHEEVQEVQSELRAIEDILRSGKQAAEMETPAAAPAESPLRPATPVAPKAAAPVPEEPPPVPPPAKAQVATGSDLFLLEDMPPASVRRGGGGGVREMSANPFLQAVDTQMVERALTRELSEEPQTARKAQEKRVALARFELEFDELFQLKTPEALEIAVERLTAFTARTCSAPALFFTVHEASRRAVLTACSGIDTDPIGNGVSFPLSEGLPERVAQAAKAGKIYSVSEYLPLATLIQKKWGARSIRAWAIHGPKRARFYGILVVVGGSEEIKANAETLTRLIRGTGHFYENAIVEN